MGSVMWTAAWLLTCLAVWPSAVTAGPHAARTVRVTPIEAKAPADHMDRRTRSAKLGGFLQLGEASSEPLQTARQFGSAVLECEFQGSPPPTISWLRGKTLGRQLPNGPGEKMKELRDQLAPSLQSLLLETPSAIVATRSRLYLQCLTAQDQGEYTCQGRTVRDVATTTTQLYVTGPASEEGLLDCEDAKDTPFQPAHIVQWRSKLLAMMGSQVRLVCATTGYPAPTITWTRNHRPINTDSGRITLTTGGDLIIDGLQWSDMGQYQCTASNDFSSDTVTSFLYPFRARK